MIDFDFESHFEAKAHRDAFNSVSHKSRCSDCGSYLCTCQSVLQDFGVVVKKSLKGLSMAQMVANCPHNCVNYNIACCDCFKKNSFEMVVKL